MLTFIEPVTGVRFTELPDPWKGKISPLTLKNCESLGWVIEGSETTEDVSIGAPTTTTTTTTTPETPTNEEGEAGEATPVEEIITEEPTASPTISLHALAGILDAQYEPLPESSASYVVSMPYALSPLEDTTFLPYTFPDTAESPDAVEKTLSLRSMLLAEELLLTEDPLVAATIAPLFIVPIMDEALDMEFAAHAEWYSLLEEESNPLYGIVGEEFVSPPVAAWNASQLSISSPEEYIPFSYRSRKCRKVFEESSYYDEALHGFYKQRALYASERWTLCRVDYALTLDLANAIAEGRDEEPALRPILTREGLGDNLHWPAAFDEKSGSVDGYVQADDLDPEEPVVFSGLGQLSYDTENDVFQSSITLIDKPLPRIDQSINGTSRATADNFIVRKVFETPFLEHPFYKKWQTLIHPEMNGFPQMLQSIGAHLDEAYAMADILSHHEQVRIDVPTGAMYVEIVATEPVERKGAEQSYVIMTEDSVSARILYDAIPYARVYPYMDLNRSRIRPMNANGYATRDIQGAMCILLDLSDVHAYTKGLQIRWWFSPTSATIWLPLEYHRCALVGSNVQPYVPPFAPPVIPTPSESGFEESGESGEPGEPGSGTGWLRVVGEGFNEPIEWMDGFNWSTKYAEGDLAEFPVGERSINIGWVGGGVITGVSVTILEGVMLTGTLTNNATLDWNVSTIPQ